MPYFASTLAEVVALGSGLAGLFFSVALVGTLLQAHLNTVAGQPRAVADLLERLLPIVVCFAVAQSAPQVGAQVAALTASGATGAEAALALWHSVANVLVKMLLGSVGASLAVGVATGALSAQLEVLSGQPQRLSAIGVRVGLVVLTAVLTLLSLQLVDLVFTVMR